MTSFKGSKPGRVRPLLLALVMFGAGMLAAAHIGKTPPALSAIRAELGLGLVAAGWAMSIFSLMTMATGIAAGVVADRLGHRRVLIAGLAVMAVGGVAGSLAESGWFLMLTRIAEGIGFVVIIVAAPALIANATEGAARKRALTLWTPYFPAGIAAMMLLTPVLLGAFGWRGTWLALSVAIAAWMVLVVAATKGLGGAQQAPKESPNRKNGSPWSDIRLTAGQIEPWLLAASFILFHFLFSAVVLWLPTFLIETRGSGTFAASVLTALVVAAFVPGNLAGGWLVQRGVAYWRVLAFGTIGMTFALVMIFAAPIADELRYIACLFYALVGGAIPAAGIVNLPAIAPTPRQIGATNGMIMQGGHTGQLFGPPAVGIVVALTGGWQPALWVLLAAAAANIGLALVIRGALRRAAARAAI